MPGPIFRRGEQLTLNPVEPEDYGFVHRQFNDPVVRRGINKQRPYTREDVVEAIESEGTTYLLACADGTSVGLVFLFRIDEVADRAELGYLVAPDEQGNGYATEAARLTAEYAADELGFRKLVARVFETNPPSMRVLEKIGFESEGLLRDHYLIDGEYVDAQLYGWFSDRQRGYSRAVDFHSRNNIKNWIYKWYK